MEFFNIIDDTEIEKLKDELELAREEIEKLKAQKIESKQSLRNAYNKYRNTEKGKKTISDVKKRYYQRLKAKKAQELIEVVEG